ncbi:MAG: hypothetical protein ISR48_01135 [Alphaproteobacteria bacterium]|nr:hypothetical protein [Alphaproteobacteria bacterium]
MPKTDITKPESEDLAELSDEALDRAANSMACTCNCIQSCTGCLTSLPSE